jgi:hypothetical protein
MVFLTSGLLVLVSVPFLAMSLKSSTQTPEVLTVSHGSQTSEVDVPRIKL